MRLAGMARALDCEHNRQSTKSSANLPTPMCWHEVLQQYLCSYAPIHATEKSALALVFLRYQ
jgi:hypothetical protein